MKRDHVLLTLIWIGFTVGGIIWVQQPGLLPFSAAHEAIIIDDAFIFMMVLGMPVFTFVLVGLIYSVIRFRHTGETAPDDGPPIHTNKAVTRVWFGVTTLLAIFIIFNPGLKGIRELSVGPDADLVVQIEARKWNWKFSYPEYGVEVVDALELVLPVDQRIRFEVSSVDIIHSFWVPAFRMKVDAMPGQTNLLFATPTQTGSFSDDINLRVQCAELCGTGHARMRAGVVILEKDEFDEWILEQTSGGQ